MKPPYTEKHRSSQDNTHISEAYAFAAAFASADVTLGIKKIASGCTAITAYLCRNTNTLVTANVGDARAVLCRNMSAVRLSYDHKASDPHEARRIVEAGGFVMNNRVSGSYYILSRRSCCNSILGRYRYERFCCWITIFH